MRVVHVVPALFGREGVVGGAERYALELARCMAAAVPTRLVSFGPVARTERFGALEIRILRAMVAVRGQRTNPFTPWLIPELRWATVVHCHQRQVVMSTLAALWCRLARRRVFVSDLGGGGWDLSAYVSTDRLFHGHLHISEYSRQISGHAGVRRARVILGGVDTERFSPGPGRSDDPTVLFVGRLVPHKGIEDLIEGVPADVRLHVVGPRTDPAFATRLAELARGRRVDFSHDLDDDGVVASYREARCVVLPSVYRARNGQKTRVPELLGQTLLEGMSCGLPAICTNVASMPEVVEDGVTGFVVPPNDPASLGECIKRIIDDPRRAAEMGAAGRERVLRLFSWRAVVERCLVAYSGAG